MKGFVIGILALTTLVLSVVFMPWAELGFGLDPAEITTDSMLAGPLHAFADSMKGFDGIAHSLQGMVTGQLNTESQTLGIDKDPKWERAVKAGNYSYVLFMAGAMVAAAIAIIAIGREDAEEKTVLPLKK